MPTVFLLVIAGCAPLPPVNEPPSHLESWQRITPENVGGVVWDGFYKAPYRSGTRAIYRFDVDANRITGGDVTMFNIYQEGPVHGVLRDIKIQDDGSMSLEVAYDRGDFAGKTARVHLWMDMDGQLVGQGKGQNFWSVSLSTNGVPAR